VLRPATPGASRWGQVTSHQQATRGSLSLDDRAPHLLLMKSRFALLLATIAVAAAAVAAWLFPRAMPIVALEQSLSRDVALARADSFFRAHSLAPTGARTPFIGEGRG